VGDCSKDGKSLEVTGESNEMKKAACEAQKGVWSETVVEAPTQTAGPTGGW
jgi:hypothetical protein